MKSRKASTISLTLATLIFLGLLYIVPPVAASGILVTPIGQTIDALPDTNFTLNFKMIFNESDDGYFSATFYWDNNETAPEPEKWNFTYQDLVCKFTDGTPFSGSIDVSITKAIPYGYPPGYYRYTVAVTETYGESYGNSSLNDEEFWLNVTMRSAGLKDGVYYSHTPFDQNITISKVRCYESTPIESGPGIVTIHFPGGHDVSVTSVAPKCSTTFTTCPFTPITVTVKNNGDFSETFSVSACCNNGTLMVIGTKITTLDPGQSKNLTFNWALSGYAVDCYVISANASIVAGETNTSDNSLVDGNMKIHYGSDANGDGFVGGYDATIVGINWWTNVPQCHQADYNCDGFVGGYDATIVGINWWTNVPKPGSC